MYTEFLEYVLKSITQYPEDVSVVESRDDMGVLLTVDVHKDDMGKIIGKMGYTTKAIRTLIRVVGMKHGARVSLKVNEPVGGMRYEG